MVLALLGPLEVEFLINTSLEPQLFRQALSHLEECYMAVIEQF